MHEAAEAADKAKLASLGPPLGFAGASQRQVSAPSPFDVWVEGMSSYFVNDRIDGRRQGHASILHAGADAVVMPGLLVGVMGSWDWVADSGDGGLQREGRGWMAGPYVSARLTRNLYFDARATWGRSTNHVDPLGAFTDTFSTTRALAAAKLTGDWTYGSLRFRPSAEVMWFSETAEAYTNAIGIGIAGQTFSVGRTMFGPEVGYRLQLADNSVVEPFIGFKGVWDFARTQETTAAGVPLGGEGIHGRAEAGLSFRAPSGIMIRAAGSYDGIGDADFRAWQGRATLVVPLR
jgi:outer membrane autotransporter protein